jgi:hypothetical protein
MLVVLSSVTTQYFIAYNGITKPIDYWLQRAERVILFMSWMVFDVMRMCDYKLWQQFACFKFRKKVYKNTKLFSPILTGNKPAVSFMN